MYVLYITFNVFMIVGCHWVICSIKKGQQTEKYIYAHLNDLPFLFDMFLSLKYSILKFVWLINIENSCF